MLYDFINTDKNLGTPMYQQIYLSVRKAIESGNLKKGSKLPSVRRLSADRGISKTTVTGAYDQLRVEGYIVSKPQSGYYVAAQFAGIPQKTGAAEERQSEILYAEYDFSGKSIDESVIDLAEWKKSIKDVINRNYLLTSYGDSQGEETLRQALQKYALGIRSVNARADNIVVGAGTQAILYLLCSLAGFGKTAALERSAFVQAEVVFKSFNYNIRYCESDADGAVLNSINEISPDIILINPNCCGTRGESMPVTRRLELIEWARKNGALIIEDDYNGELRYRTRPVPCVQNYDVENTVYIGSFSKVLLPSVRISYMVLPPTLMKEYDKSRRLMNQTASKTEQLALAKYIENGKIDAHLRKARRVYSEKSKVLTAEIEKHLPKAVIGFNETALYITVRPPFKTDREKAEKALAQRSVRIMPKGADGQEYALSFSGISQERIREGVRVFCETLEENKIIS